MCFGKKIDRCANLIDASPRGVIGWIKNKKVLEQFPRLLGGVYRTRTSDLLRDRQAF